MGSCLQYGLRELTLEFLNVKEIGPKEDKRLKTPQPRVPVPYTYLIAWFIMHCPSLMTGVADAGDLIIPFVQRFKSAQWRHTYIVLTRQLLSKADSYRVLCCSPDFDGAEKRGPTFMDVGSGGFTSLPEGVFKWLITIRPGYLVFRLGDRCIIEPYLPSRFARQFGYDQLYVGNPNPQLALVGNLYEGARAWYYWTAGNSFAVFVLPSSTPNCYMALGFCDWYRETSQVPEYCAYTSCLKDIRGMYESKKDSKATRLKGVDEYLICERERSQAGYFPEGAMGTEARKEIMAGKRALSVEEETRYEKKARQGIVTRSHSPRGPKLMHEAIRSAPMSGAGEKPTVMSAPLLTIPVEEEREVINVDDASPVPVAFRLRFYIKELEGMLRCAATSAMRDRGSFEMYRPHIMKLLNRVKQFGGSQWFDCCTERISLLEKDLKALQELECADVDAEGAHDAHQSKIADLKHRLTVIFVTGPSI